jgi:hypothetical protein
MATIFTSGQFQAIGNDGKVVPYGKLYFYEAGTLTPVNSYTTALKDATNTIPVVISASGKADVFLDEGVIDIVLKDSLDVVVWTIENYKTSNTFDNTGTGLAATNNQEAIEEINVKLNGSILNPEYKIDTIADLRLMTELPSTVWVTGYHTANDGAFGSHFFRLATDTGQVDNGGTIIRTVNGVYELQYDGAVNVKWFGAVDLDNIIGVRSFFGCALKNTRSNLNNGVFLDNGSDSIIVKSDTSSGKSEEVNINNVVCSGDPLGGTSFNIRISAFNLDVDDINISNVSGSNASYLLYLDASSATSGVIKQVNTSNMNGSNIGRGVLADGGSGTGSIENISINNTNLDEVDFRPLEIKGNVSRIAVNNWYSSNISGATLMTSAFQILPEVTAVELSNITLVENYDNSLLGTVNLANPNTHNIISGGNRFNIGGVGIPLNGTSSDSTLGLTIALSPSYESRNKSVIEMSGSGTRTVISIETLLSSGTKFPNGYELIVINNASGTVTLQHGGTIFNTGSTNVLVAPNETVRYMFFGSVWHQV